MLSPELLRKIQRIYIKSRYLATDAFAGEYETAFKGRGMEFEEVREYTPGDDVRSIDWNVSARIGSPYVKVFREEREQTVMLLVDSSASENFGSRERAKKDVVTEIAAVLAYAAIKSNDKVGLIIFSDRVEKFVPPKKGRAHVWQVISEILSFKPQGKGTDITAAMQFLNQVIRRRSVGFLISDFLADGYESALRVARFKHDLAAILVRDPLERHFPQGGLVTIRDLETGLLMTVDLTRPGARALFRDQREKEIENTVKAMRAMQIDCLNLESDRDYIEPLLKFFRQRDKRFR